MKDKTLKKSAHILSGFLNVGCVLFGVFSVLLFVGIVAVLGTRLFSPETFHAAWEAGVQAGQTLSFGQSLFFFICCLGEMICIFLALFHAKKIFGCIGRGNSPFTPKTATQIRKIAGYVLLFSVISELSVFKMLSLPSFILCMLFVLILFCISLIFDYGCELQQEIDETL